MLWVERDDYEEDGLELTHGAAFWAFCASQYACLTAVLPPPTTADRHLLRAVVFWGGLAAACCGSSPISLAAAALPAVELLASVWSAPTQTAAAVFSTQTLLAGLLLFGHRWDARTSLQTMINSMIFYASLSGALLLFAVEAHT